MCDLQPGRCCRPPARLAAGAPHNPVSSFTVSLGAVDLLCTIRFAGLSFLLPVASAPSDKMLRSSASLLSVAAVVLLATTVQGAVFVCFSPLALLWSCCAVADSIVLVCWGWGALRRAVRNGELRQRFCVFGQVLLQSNQPLLSLLSCPPSIHLPSQSNPTQPTLHRRVASRRQLFGEWHHPVRVRESGGWNGLLHCAVRRSAELVARHLRPGPELLRLTAGRTQLPKYGVSGCSGLGPHRAQGGRSQHQLSVLWSGGWAVVRRCSSVRVEWVRFRSKR